MPIESKTKKFDLSNRLYVLIAILFAFCLIYAAFSMFYTWKSFDANSYDQLTVSGEGKVYITPDIATLTLGVQTDGKDVKEITQKNTTLMNNMIDDIKSLGIESKDIQTTQYSVSPKYNWTEDKGQVLEGYTISQNIEIKIRDFSKIGDVLNAGTQNGANIVNNLQFTIEDQEKFKSKAREDAIAQAKEKAAAIASESGIKLGKLININDESSPIYNQSVMYAKTINESDSRGGGVSANIEAGQQELTITVNLTYKIK